MTLWNLVTKSKKALDHHHHTIYDGSCTLSRKYYFPENTILPRTLWNLVTKSKKALDHESAVRTSEDVARSSDDRNTPRTFGVLRPLRGNVLHIHVNNGCNHNLSRSSKQYKMLHNYMLKLLTNAFMSPHKHTAYASSPCHVQRQRLTDDDGLLQHTA